MNQTTRTRLLAYLREAAVEGVGAVDAMTREGGTPIWIWVVGGGAIVVGVCACGYVGWRWVRGQVVGRLQHQEARDVEAAVVRPEAAVSTEEEQELGEGHVKAQVHVEENGLNVDEQFFECKWDQHEHGSFNEAAAKGVTIRPEDRDALLELLYSELQVGKAKQGGWAEVTGVTKAQYLASLVNKPQPTVDVEDIGAKQEAGGVWVPRKK